MRSGLDLETGEVGEIISYRLDYEDQEKSSDSDHYNNVKDLTKLIGKHVLNQVKSDFSRPNSSTENFSEFNNMDQAEYFLGNNQGGQENDNNFQNESKGNFK